MTDWNVYQGTKLVSLVLAYPFTWMADLDYKYHILKLESHRQV